MIKTGDLIACRGKWWLSRAIRWVTMQEYSHVGVALNMQINGHKELVIFEAMEGKGIRISPMRKEFFESNEYVTHYKYSGDGERILCYLLSRWDDDYAPWYQFLLGMSPLLQRLRKNKGLSLDVDKKRDHCSELIAHALEHNGHKLFKNPALMTPTDLTFLECYSNPARLS